MKIHIVQKGDTLWNLAQKYNVNFEELKAANDHLSNPDMIMPGMKIKIPTGSVQVKKEAPKHHVKKEAPIVDKAPVKEKPIPKEEPVVKEKPIVKEEPKPAPIPQVQMPQVQMPQMTQFIKHKPTHQDIEMNFNFYKPQPKKPAPPVQPIKQKEHKIAPPPAPPKKMPVEMPEKKPKMPVMEQPKVGKAADIPAPPPKSIPMQQMPMQQMPMQQMPMQQMPMQQMPMQQMPMQQMPQSYLSQAYPVTPVMPGCAPQYPYSGGYQVQPQQVYGAYNQHGQMYPSPANVKAGGCGCGGTTQVSPSYYQHQMTQNGYQGFNGYHPISPQVGFHGMPAVGYPSQNGITPSYGGPHAATPLGYPNSQMGYQGIPGSAPMNRPYSYNDENDFDYED